MPEMGFDVLEYWETLPKKGGQVNLSSKTGLKSGSNFFVIFLPYRNGHNTPQQVLSTWKDAIAWNHAPWGYIFVLQYGQHKLQHVKVIAVRQGIGS